MTARVINYDSDDEPEVGVRELIKTPRSSSSTRLEYKRMMAERALAAKAHNLLSPVMEEPPQIEPHTERRFSFEDNVAAQQEAAPDIASFPFISHDVVDGGSKKKSSKHVEASEHPGRHKHGARLCMVSAIVHMKCLAERKPKSIKQLRKNPVTSQQEKLRNNKSKPADDDTDSEPEDELAYLKNCRYLRGTDEDKELSIEDIFG